MAEKRPRVSREEWAKRVQRWRDSGLTASEFARELGINASTLTYWSCELRKTENGADGERVAKRAAKTRSQVSKPHTSMIQVQATGVSDGGFVLELSGGRRLRIPRDFDDATLRRLVAVLEAS